MRSSSLSVVLSVFLQQDGENDFLSWLGYPREVSQYKQVTWELKSVLVLSNAQLFDRSLPIYYRVHEVPFYTPQGYVKSRLIYRLVHGRTTSPRDEVQAIERQVLCL